MLRKCQERSRLNRVVHSTRKSVWIEYEWQKKRLSQCPEKYETEARKVAEILGL
jgi:hypothetical protein